MKYLPLFLFPILCFAQTAPIEKPIETKALSAIDTSKSVLVIDPKHRGEDLLEAYTLISKDKISSKIFFRLKNGEVLNNIQKPILLNNGTLFLIKSTSNVGVFYRAVYVEDIVEVGHT